MQQNCNKIKKCVFMYTKVLTRDGSSDIIKSVLKDTKEVNKMDKFLLEYEIKRNGLTVKQLCEAIGISTSAYYKKLKGVSEFTQGEIQSIISLLGVTDPTPIFFNPKVS